MIFASMLMSLFLGLAQAGPPSNPSPSPNKSTDNSKSEDPYRDLESFKKHVAKLVAVWYTITSKRAGKLGLRFNAMKKRGIHPAWEGDIPGIDKDEASRASDDYDRMVNKYNMEYVFVQGTPNAFASHSLDALEKGTLSFDRERVEEVKAKIHEADSGYRRFIEKHKRGDYDDMWNRYERFLHRALDYLGRKEGLKTEEIDTQKRDGGRQAYIRTLEADYDNFKAYTAVAEAFIKYAERHSLIVASKPKG